MKLLKTIYFFLLAVLSANAYSISWKFTSCTSLPNSTHAPCTYMRANSLYEICASQITIRPDVFLGIKSIHVYDVNPNSMRAYCYYDYQLIGGVGTASNHVMATPESCPEGEKFDSATFSCVKVHRSECNAGNPIDIYNGRKIQAETDYQYKISSSEAITAERFYNSRNDVVKETYNENTSYGGKWRFSYTDKLTFFDFKVSTINKKTASYKSPRGNDLQFFSDDGILWTDKSGAKNILSYFLGQNGLKYWKLMLKTGEVNTFDSTGKLIKVDEIGKSPIELFYSSSVGLPEWWDSVTIKRNNNILFTYHIERKPYSRSKSSRENVIKLTTTGSNYITYEYDSIGNLVKVKHSSGTERQYHYENSIFFKMLTGVTDERGTRYATWVYDNVGRAISSEHAGGAEKTLLSFNADGSTTVTNALNKQTIYRFTDIAGARRITSVEGQPTANCAGANQGYTYTPEGWLESKTDWNGIKTKFQYNSKGQETSRTEAFGTSESRTTITEWHPTFFVKTKTTDLEKETIYNYDADGRLLNQSTTPITIQQ